MDMIPSVHWFLHCCPIHVNRLIYFLEEKEEAMVMYGFHVHIWWGGGWWPVSVWRWIQNEKPSTSPTVFNYCWPVEMLQAKQSKGIGRLQYYFVPVRRDKSWHLDRTNRFCCKQNTWAFYCGPSFMSLATVTSTTNTWSSFVPWKIWKYVQFLQTSVSTE